MTRPEREVHVERILGRRVRDVNGEVIGRLEEIVALDDGGEAVVDTFHVGPAALLERIGRFVQQIPPLHRLPMPHWEYRIPWHQFDLSDPRHPRVRCARSDLRRVKPERGD